MEVESTCRKLVDTDISMIKINGGTEAVPYLSGQVSPWINIYP